jgi:hypothetical protein
MSRDEISSPGAAQCPSENVICPNIPHMICFAFDQSIAAAPVASLFGGKVSLHRSD